MAFIDYFKSLKDMPIDYGNNDYQSQYRGIISQEIFEETLSYDAFRDDEKRIGEYFNPRHRIYTGVFHLVLNVKVDSMSKFIPFAFVTNTDPLNKDKAEENKDKAKEIIKKKQNDIKFNFTDLLDEFCNIKGDAIDTISFKTTIGRNGLRISGLDVDNDTSLINDYKDYLKKFLKQKGNFISILSESYNSENIANKLFFSIISFDYDIVSDRKLTHILIISENKDESEYFIQYRIRVLRDIVSLLRTRYINDIAKKNRLESLKSAVSAIMSRNMSHNLGSHCLHYTKSSLENLSARLYGHGPEIRGAARLISYIQGRMDFLATLVSGEEYPYGAVNFKSQIIDILTVDDFSKRHYKASSIKDKYKIIKQNKLQTALESLSSQLDGIISAKKERNNIELTKVVNATENLIQQLENLKLDNANLRTTNFLLENLIKSERFYREDIYDNPIISQDITEKPFYLYVRYNGVLFTGSEHNIVEEETIKAKLSELNIAMPGGLMSTHAFFNIVENLIRNSAKHRATDLTEEALITTIDIREEKSPKKHRLQFTIYDNKHNGNIAYPIIIKQLKELQILNIEDSTIDKKSKGFKEMLIAALWLRSNEEKDNYSVLLNKIENEKDEDLKLSLIRNYAYEIVKVDNDGNVSESFDANLGLRFYLPVFETCTPFKLQYSPKKNVSERIINTLRKKQVKADIVVMNECDEIMHEAYKRFPRLYDETTIIPPEDISIIENEVIENKKVNKVAFNETLMLYFILKKRFGDDIVKYQVVFGESPKSITLPANVIYFQRHFNKSQDFSEASNFMYADSVSGGNFTVTLQDNFLRGQSTDGKCLTWKDKYFSYKIIESALTRITLIDERLSDDYNEQELRSKNLRVLNLNPETPDENEIWSGSSFKDKDDYTLFLSIHLGLIEKVINNENNWFMRQYNKEFANNNKKRPERATFFMELLRRKFGKGKEIFISVHSGRGNYSYDLEHSLKEYPFINLSAIESVFSNSKYLLAQLFYNTIYIGKGEYNQKQS